MPRQILHIILLLTLIASSCAQKKKGKYMYFGLQDALHEESPEKVRRLRLSPEECNSNSVAEKLRLFPNLQELNMSNNKLRSIPAWLSQFTKLEEHDLSANLIDTLYPSFFEMKNLTFFKIWGNQLKNIPAGFGKMKRLKSLNFGSNNLHELPGDFSALDSLNFLSIDLNDFRQLPAVIYSLKSIKNLTLYDNHISEISDSISKLSGLTQLSVDKNYLSSARLTHLKKILPNCLIGRYDQREKE